MGENTNKCSQGTTEYLLILAAVLVVAAIAIYYVSRGPTFPIVSIIATTDDTKDNIQIRVYSGSIPAGEWEYRITQTQGTGTWLTGNVALAADFVNLENKSATPGTWYVSLKHKTSGHVYFTDQAVTVE